jgi:hypothetical protein
LGTIADRTRRGIAGAGVLLVVAAVSSAAAGPAHARDASGVARLVPLFAATVIPGEYAVLAFSVENLSDEPASWIARIGVPPDWSAVTPERSVTVEPGSTVVVPFSLWVGAHSTPDRSHACRVELLDAAGKTLAVSSTAIRVARRHEFALTTAETPTSGSPGGRVAHAFRVTNRGNGADTLALRVESVPPWPVALPAAPLVVAPGESRDLILTVAVPETGRDGSRHLLGLTVFAHGDTPPERPTGSGNGSIGTVATAQAITRIASPASEPSPHTWLPAELATSLERTELGETVFGLRFGTAGEVGGGTNVELSVDLLSEPRNASEEGWQNQRWRLSAAGHRWEAAAGDVHKQSGGLAVRSLWGRGIRLQRAQGSRSVSAYAIRDRASDVERSLGLDLEQQVGGSVRLRSELVRRRVAATAWRPEGWRDLISLALEGSPAAGLRMGVESGWSKSPSRSGAIEGTALQLTSSFRNQALTADLRCFTAAPGYQGWNQDRDGVAAYARYLPTLGATASGASHPLALWLSVDAYQGRPSEGDSIPICRSDRSRIGSRFSWAGGPVAELSAGYRREQDRIAGGRNHEWRDLGLSAWQTFGTLMLAGSCRWGRAFDRRSAEGGDLSGLVLSLGGHLLGLQATARWSQDWAWLPELDEKSVSSTRGGEFNWASRRQRLKLALGASFQTQRFPQSTRAERNEWLLRPRIEWRIVRDLAIQGELTSRSADGSFETDRCRIQLSWSRQHALPMFWEPQGGRLSGIVFLDEDSDGQPDPGEGPVEGVVFVLDGEQRMSRADGSFAYPACTPGVHDLDLHPNTLPAGRVATGAWPRPITIELGDEIRIAIPLARSGGLSGCVFRDRGNDGRMDPEDEPLADVRVLLRRGEEKVTESLTDAAGAYRFRGLAPGDYVVALDPGWVPAGWAPTVDLPRRVTVPPGDEQRVAPLGIAPKPKPVIHTFSAGGADDPAPPLDRP